MAPESSDRPGEPVDPDAILRQPFTSVRRGYDPLEVQQYLMRIAGELRAGREREREALSRAEAAERHAAEVLDPDPSRLTALLGEETARVLDAARSAATEIRAKAEENVARLLREAQDDSERLRHEAETVLARKTAEAEEAAAKVRAESDEERARARTDAAAEVEAGRQRGRDMVAEAQRVRERMLHDLARRRKGLRLQIDQLQAARDRLLEAYAVVRETVDIATGELDIMLPEAKEAAEAAAQQVQVDDESAFATELLEVRAEVAEEISDESVLEPVDLDVEPVADFEEVTPVAGDEVAAADDVEVEPVPAEEPSPATEPEPGPPTEAVAVFDVDEEEQAESATEAASPAKAPDPAEGRQSSSVRVIRGVPDPSALFARIKEETAPAEPDLVVPSAVVDEVVVERVEVGVDDAGVVEVVDTEVVVVAVAESDEASPDAAALAERDRAVVEIERALSRKLKRELSDEQNEVLDAVRREKGAPAADAVLPTPEAHVERYAAVASALLAEAAAAGAAFAVSLGVKGRAEHRTKVDEAAAELAGEVVGPLRERLERCFAEADGDPDGLDERLRACFREWKTQRIDQPSSFAVLAAFNRGLLDRLPAGTPVHWIADDGDTPAPDCDDNALAGSIPKGEPFPTGHLAPPIHPACRCLVAPDPV